MSSETPVLDALGRMTATSITNSNLGDRERTMVRIAGLVAVDAPPSSYLLNVGSAAEDGITLHDVEGILIALAPILGTTRIIRLMSADNIFRALGFAIAVDEDELADEEG